MKKPHKIPDDAKWRKENIQTLTAKAFFDEYNFTDSRKASRRYKEICADYVEDVAEQEANELRNGDEELSTQTQARIDAAASEVNLNDEQARTLLYDEPAQESTHHEHVQQEPLNDIQDCLRIFKNEVKRIIQGNQTLKMEEHVQELLSLNNILLLQPLQYIHLMRSVFFWMILLY
ncbi:hypothetical protein HMPREF1544_04546 [Mucor circinelloides 1006PhL]|uniref:Uncharacterized protein n=1 Tax=Mucor circinelloides f. circinelloides (strain 1006PhL) TaxID=1220926 RepID=S2JFK8_MUCC1|nr:hypothetical protein HMPREF1544_04546 [Mucor circinelloides 1006PhL]